MANPIYNGLLWIEENYSVLVIKLIAGKTTYIHKCLFDDIYAIVCKQRDWQLKNLKEDELVLLKYVLKNGKVTSDDPKLKK